MSSRKEQVRQFQTITIKAVIVIAIMFYPIGLVHESGHALVCVSKGGSFTWSGFFMLSVTCSDNFPFDSYMLLWSMGGIFGLISSSLFLISKKVRRTPYILIGVLTMAWLEFVYCIFETFAHFAYLHSLLAYMLMAFSIVIVLFGLVFLTVRAKRKTQKPQ